MNQSKRKFKARNGNQPLKSKSSSVARKITLKDELPSAIAVRVECHKVLWAMVSLTSGMSAEISTDDAIEEGTIAKGIVVMNTKKRRIMSRFGINDNVSKSFDSVKDSNYTRDARLSRLTGIILAMNDSRDMWYEHIYMMKHSTDGQLYPGRVEGVGPSSYSVSEVGGTRSNNVTALMSFLGNPKIKFEVPRSTMYLFQPTKCDLVEIRKLFHEKFCDLPGVDALLAPTEVHSKYWDQRYRLFRKFDYGVQLDKESWYSITPEEIGIYLAKKVRNRLRKLPGQFLRVIIDAFSGCGGCAIPLAATALNVHGQHRGLLVAVDMDHEKLDKLMHNAGVYESTSHIQVECAEVNDLLRVLPELAHERTVGHEILDFKGNWKEFVDLIVLSPPWGGPEYLNQRSFSLRNLPECCGCGLALFRLAAAKSPNVVYMVPRNVPKSQLESLARSCLLHRGAKEVSESDFCIEDIYLHGKHKVTILYIGPLFQGVKKEKTNLNQPISGMDIDVD